MVLDATKRQLLTLFVVVFLELLAYCFVMPAFYPIFLDSSSGLLAETVSLASRKTLYGALMMCYPLAQIMGAPLMGHVSDKIGRRKVLSITLSGNVLGYLFAALALTFHRVELIFIGFTLSGLTGGNIPVSQSAIADISPSHNKARNMSLVFASYGICYIIGSWLGGALATVESSGLTPYALPYWMAACISTLNLVFVALTFQETFLKKSTYAYGPRVSFKEIIEQLRLPHNLKLISVIFLSFFGWNFSIKVMQIFLSDNYAFLAKENAFFLAYFGLWTLLTQALFIPLLSKRFCSSQFMIYASFVLGISLIVLPLTITIESFFVVFTFAALGYSFILPSITAIISNLNSKDSQGKIMGISQSIQSLAKTLAPVPAALLATIDAAYPLFVSGAILLLAWFLFTFVFQFNKSALQTSK